MTSCKIDGCSAPVCTKGFCNKHYIRFRKHGNPHYMGRGANGSGSLNSQGYVQFHYTTHSVKQHVLLAELALGHQLPTGAEVHHVDGNRANNAPSNLVICPSRAYHQLLHKRTRAYDACGNANHVKCAHCGNWESPTGMRSDGFRHYHPACRASYMSAKHQERKARARI